QGLEVACVFLDRFFGPEFASILSERRHLNFKSLLQELVQAERQVTPSYRTVSSAGPDHARQFTVEVLIQNEVAGRGRGRSKQEAEQEAARLALEAVGGGER